MLTNKIPWIILLGLWMAGSTWWHVCKIKQLCVDDVKAAPATTEETGAPAPLNGFTIADGDRFRLDLPGNFSFAKSGANANMNSLGGSLDEMVAYLKANPGRTLEIKGYYSANETNSTSFPNLGIARAEGLKQYLVQQGIPAESITTTAEERNLTFTAKGDSLYGGLDFAFGGVTKPTEAEPVASTTAEPVKITKEVTEKELANNEKFTSVFKPIDLYFQLGESNYIKTEDTKKFFGEAIRYLADHKDKKLLLTGHTDSSGPEDVNMQLSRDRANDVKVRLRKAGVPSEQIIVKAKGETEPKADNSTMSGRKANRRVTVVVQ
ncbi:MULTISPECIES: OmpA family protein [unclassified Spirosoma]|uniref:OmpA family protein n=1 Tax=unclassified Spirosoma TaxID=2621999 RepID=UPI0009683A1C|nr:MULTISPECIES: OmpA family protein [unclassified Spirosoma]MBN8826497.1 OmpA family protein [Spirosoma sp.]OJW76412.1 MAG: flagellar motor protein MotB [Spirosoma sp. 48-14]